MDNLFQLTCPMVGELRVWECDRVPSRSTPWVAPQDSHWSLVRLCCWFKLAPPPPTPAVKGVPPHPKSWHPFCIESWVWDIGCPQVLVCQCRDISRLFYLSPIITVIVLYFEAGGRPTPTSTTSHDLFSSHRNPNDLPRFFIQERVDKVVMEQGGDHLSD